MKSFTLYFIFQFLLIQPLTVFCWGGEGHRAIGTVAYHYLHEQTKDSLKFYLGDVTIEKAGTWMDEMRSNHAYDYMKPWHYVDYEKGTEYKPGPQENVINELNKRIEKLKHRNLYSKEEVATDITILIHLTEDLHMPLHAGYLSDTGGLAVHITFMGQPTSLHWAWDHDIMLQQKINADSCIALLQTFSKKRLMEERKTDILKWMHESRSYLPQVYDFNGTSINEAYADKNAPVIKLRMAVAGLRLSYLLNDLFKR